VSRFLLGVCGCDLDPDGSILAEVHDRNVEIVCVVGSEFLRLMIMSRVAV